MKWFKVLPTLVLGLVASIASIYCQVDTLIFAWMEKPPYAISPGNGSRNRDVRGIILDALMEPRAEDSCRNYPQRRYLKVNHEFEMIDLLRQNKAHVAFPIFEQAPNRQYREFPFVKLDDYPGTEYITKVDDDRVLNVVLNSVLKSWPLFAVTLVLTAIAGIIMWCLDTYWNSEEFSRHFLKGSWDGFWWSFISMTTVGYGDKSPKSIPARIFSIIWILVGLIIMAIFMANITSALTAASLNVGPSDLAGRKVAVLGNGTEYQHAVQEGAHPEDHKSVDDMVDAVNSEKVEAIMLDHYTSQSFHQETDKLKSLLFLKKFDFSREMGVLFSRDKKNLAECLNNHRSYIFRKIQESTQTYKSTNQRPAKTFNLFDESSPFVMHFLYISLGVLCALLVIGTVVEIVFRQRNKVKQNAPKGSETGESSKESATISDDVEAAKIFLRKAEEHLLKLEGNVSKFQIKQSAQ